jgi:iron(III) transport system permease protein
LLGVPAAYRNAKRAAVSVAALLLLAAGLLPVISMAANSFYLDGRFSLAAYKALWVHSGQQLTPMGHSLLLSLSVAVMATVVGVPLGIVVGKTDLPFPRVFAALFTVPLLIPSYVLAVAWTAVFGSSGWVARSLAPETAKYLSTALFGLTGCAGVLFTALTPIVILLTIAYLGFVNPRLEDAGRLVGRWPEVLRYITLPIIAPAILFATLLVFLLTLGEVGVPSYLRYSVYPAEILTQFAAFYDFRAATAAATPLVFVTLLIVGVEYWLLRRQSTETRVALTARQTRIELKRWRWPLAGCVLAWGIVTVLLPLSVLAAQSLSYPAYAEAFTRATDSLLRSMALAIVGATALTVVGFLCAYLIHDRTLTLWRGVDVLALFLFALPGTVIGIGLIGLWNTPVTSFLYGSPVIVIVGYLAQYAILPTRMVWVTLERIPATVEYAAQICGATWIMTLRHILAPLASRGLIAAWICSYVFCMRDLGVGMVVYPPGSDTLPVHILTLMANGAPSLIAALCVILIGATILPFGLVALCQRREERTA